jgi:2'-5' RNA ligase
MVRLFVAIDLDDAARAAIADEQKRLMRAFGRSDHSLRWVGPDQMHLTLVFVGNVDDQRAAAVIDAMREDIHVAPFAMAFARIGVFPPHGAPNVLWIGVGDGADDAIDVQRHVADRLAKLDVPRERRPYHPHLTLARWRSSRPSDRRRVADVRRDDEVARVDVRAVTLYRSHLSSKGSTYEALTRAQLQS